jgi:hypothetical protein
LTVLFSALLLIQRWPLIWCMAREPVPPLTCLSCKFHVFHHDSPGLFPSHISRSRVPRTTNLGTCLLPTPCTLSCPSLTCLHIVYSDHVPPCSKTFRGFHLPSWSRPFIVQDGLSCWPLWDHLALLFVLLYSSANWSFSVLPTPQVAPAAGPLHMLLHLQECSSPPS